MPELPEVEVIVRELRQTVMNEEITDIKVLWKKSLVRHHDHQPVFAEIKDIRRYGKFIILQVGHVFLLVHLRMSGKLIVHQGGPFSRKHLRVYITFRSGKSLLFYDPRKFGRMYLTADAQQFLSPLGMDALDPGFSGREFARLLAGKNSRIKSFLLDQHHLAGLGNIYTDECLYRAGVHPQTRISNLSEREVALLFRAIKKTLQGAIEHMGTTLADYRTAEGKKGRHQRFLKVYDREQKPCFRCKNPVEKKWINGRGTHFCPVCQPLKGKS
jgi:formamidopyrimidine-DNA glycosylase